MQFRSMHALVACLLCISVSGQAQESPALTLSAALARALEHNPDLNSFAFERRGLEARGELARQRPPLQADILVEDAVGSGVYQGFDAAQTTLSLSQVFELGGQRGLRQGMASAELDALQVDQSVRQLDIVAEIARRFIRLLAQQEKVEVAREAVAAASQLEAAVRQRVEAAASPEAELLRARATSAEAALTLEDALHVQETVRFELASAIGLAEPDFQTVAGDLSETSNDPSFEVLMVRVEGSPDLARFAHEERLRDAELRLAESQRRADLRASLGLRRFEQAGDTALVAGLSLPLFASSRAAPVIAEAQARRAAIDFRRQSSLLRLRALLFSQFQEKEHAQHVATTLREQVLPLLEKAEQQTEYAYRRGRYSFLEWSEARQRLLDARIRLIEVHAEARLHHIEIERLTGQALRPAGE